MKHETEMKIIRKETKNNESEVQPENSEKKRLDRISKNPLVITPGKLLEQAKSYIKELPAGEEFFLAELFQGTYWNRVDKGTRLAFGLLFKSSVPDLDVEYVDKFSNQILYRKK